MRISGRRILSTTRHLGHIPAGTEVRVIFDATDALAASLGRAGFAEDAHEGATILPAIVGPATRFNAEGKWIVHRDQPKETRYVGTRVWRWKLWGGGEDERYVDIERECYPRTLVPPPAIELTIAQANGRMLITSPIYAVEAGDNEDLKHIINVMLELYRACDVISEEIEQYQPPQLVGVNWKFLPPGEYPWPALRPHIERALRRTSDDGKAVIEDRAETIRGYGPDRIFVGQGGFGDYLAYDFGGRNLVVLEAIRRDNALYVFGQDWENVSQLSKAQVITGNLYEHRIIHSDGWKVRLAQVMNG